MAQGLPARPVTLVIPLVAGGPTDVVTRHLATPMGRQLGQLGQPVVVENAVGAAKVAQAAPTGHTVLLHHMGTAPAMNDLMGGQVDLLCDQTTGAVPFVRDGRVKAIGVATAGRLSALPLVPTLDEQGLKGLEVKVWHGLYAPRGTPPEVVARLGEALRAALRDPQVTQRLAELNAEIPEADKLNPEGLRRHLAAEIAKWGPLIRKVGVYAD